MFSGFMANTWEVATVVAVLAGVVGFFVVARGDAFPAHAIPNGAFAGAAAASLFGFPSLLGLAGASVLSAVGIGTLGRRGRRDVVTALTLVMMLALGALFLSRSGQYEQQVYALLFGEQLGVASTEILPVVVLALVSLAAVGVLWRPLMLSSIVPDIGEARGVSGYRIEMAFLVVVALATALTVPVVGALLIFSLMIGAPAAARSFTDRPGRAVALSVVVAVVTVWLSIAIAYRTDWPIGFFIGGFGAVSYGIGRGWALVRR
ncbi:MAG: metal ABC transporter permease [Acidimicrobiales bacterium]